MLESEISGLQVVLNVVLYAVLRVVLGVLLLTIFIGRRYPPRCVPDFMDRFSVLETKKRRSYSGGCHCYQVTIYNRPPDGREAKPDIEAGVHRPQINVSTA